MGRRPRFSHRALQAWARIAVTGFYRHVDVTAGSRIPEDRPVILAANHANALADVALIVAEMPSFPRFLAAASWWKTAPARVLFGLGDVVPIHRRRDHEDTAGNVSSFAECNSALGSGAQIVIFPEGELHLEPGLLPLKTGAARIALGAAADGGLAGVVIVPVGLVYDDLGRFRSDVEIHFGEPIEIDEWMERYRDDPAGTVRRVTDLLADRLMNVTIGNGSTKAAPVLDRAAALALVDEPAPREFARRNDLRRALESAIAAAGGVSSPEYADLVKALDAHERDVARLGLRSLRTLPLDPAPDGARVRVLCELGAATLPALLGLVANAPTVLVLWLESRRVPHDAWQATVKGVSATFLGPIVWTVEFVALSRRAGRRRALALTMAGAVGGAIAVVWRDRLVLARQIAQLSSLERERPAALRQARRSRVELRRCVAAVVGGQAVGTANS